MPIDFPYVAKLAYWTTQEAIAYLLNVEPRELALRDEGNWRVYDKHKKFLTLIHRAIEAGQLSGRASGYGYQVAPRAFVAWAKKNGLKIPVALLSALDPERPAQQSESAPATATGAMDLDDASCRGNDSELGQESVTTPGHDTREGAFDPIPIDGIAGIFKVKIDDAANLAFWRTAAKYAKRKSLANARVAAGSGKAKSTFDPERVGDWLERSGKMSREKIDRVLKNNLPRRSEHLKDMYSS